MIDIHNHLLPGIDDGPQDLQASIALAEQAISSGITHVVCTPHANYQYHFDPAVNAERLARLQEAVGDKLKLYLGCDFHLSVDNLDAILIDHRKFAVNGTQYVLVELPDFFVPDQMSDVFFRMKVKGMVPIITHPERNAFVLGHIESVIPWLRSGCLIQITAGAILGRFGKQAEAAARRLLRKGWVHIIASDAHGTQSRPFLLREAYEIILKVHGRSMADRLCVQNPLAVIQGETIAPAFDMGDELDDRGHGGGFLARLFAH